MRVLHVINGLATGGAETVLYRLVTYDGALEHRVICLGGRDRYSDELERNGIKVDHLASPLGGIATPWKLYRKVRSSGADVVQTWMYRSNLLGGAAAKLAGVPVVWNIRCSSLEPLRTLTRILARIGGFVAPWVPAYVVNCSERSAEIHARLGYDAVPGGVIPNGYDAAEFRPDPDARSATRDWLGVPAGSFLIASIARWHPMKGFPTLLRALRILRDRGVPVCALLAGRGLDRDNAELAALVEENGLEDCVRLLGERSDVPAIARAIDLHALASVGSEGFPNVVAETMLSETPNVVTDVGDSALIVGDTGWVVPPADPEAIAAAMEQAYVEWKSSPGIWQSRREAARKRISEDFSLDRMVGSYEQVWTEVVTRSYQKLARAPCRAGTDGGVT